MTAEMARLAFEVSTLFTSVFRCEGDVPKECIGSVATDDPEYDLKLGQVLGQAKAFGIPSGQTEVWLADDQIILRHLRLEWVGGTERREEAGRALSAITPYQPEDLSFALGEEDADGYTAVAAVPIKKLDEIRALARSAGFQDAVVTSTDDIEGFENRPVWRGAELASATWMRVMQAACFLLAVTVPLMLAGAANNADFGSKLRSFLAFTPSVSTTRSETQVASVDPAAADLSGLQRASDANPPSLAAEYNSSLNDELGAYVQRHVGDLVVPAMARPDPVHAPIALPGFEALDVPRKPDSAMIPRPPDLGGGSAVGQEPAGLIGKIEGIEFLSATEDFAPPPQRGFGVLVANLGTNYLFIAPKSRPYRRASVAPKRLRLPNLRPLPPLPEEIYGVERLPQMRTPISTGKSRFRRPGDAMPIASFVIPAKTEVTVLEADIQDSLKVAYQMRRENAIVAAANAVRAADAWIPAPRMRDAVPVVGKGGALVQVAVGQLSEITPVSSVSQFSKPGQANRLSFAPGHPVIDASLPADVQQAMQDLFEQRAEKARLASIMNREAGAQPASPRLRERLETTEVARLVPEPQATPVVAPTPAAQTAPLVENIEKMSAPRHRNIANAPLGGVQASASVMASYLPLHRPKDLAQKAAAILKKRESAAAKVAARQEPRKTTPSQELNIPTSARVASVVTIRDGIDLSDLSLIGIFGKSNNRHALLRTSQGRIEKVKRGARVGGWMVSSIGEDGVRIQKRSQTKVLRLPN